MGKGRDYKRRVSGVTFKFGTHPDRPASARRMCHFQIVNLVPLLTASRQLSAKPDHRLPTQDEMQTYTNPLLRIRSRSYRPCSPPFLVLPPLVLYSRTVSSQHSRRNSAVVRLFFHSSFLLSFRTNYFSFLFVLYILCDDNAFHPDLLR